MEFTTAYLIGIIALIGMFAIRVPYENSRTVFALALMWPLSIVAIIVMMIILAIGWNFDIGSNTKMFGFRRPSNPNARGFAITVFTTEFQFYKVSK